MGIFDVTLEASIDDLLACPDEDVGQLLELDEIVGKGGFAAVWRAFFNGLLCACKILQPRGGALPPAPIVRLFVRECISLLSLDHSAVIRCAGLIRLRRVDFPQLGLPYDTYGMLLEFCEGGTLKDLLLSQLVYRVEQYSEGEALGWLAQVASALNQFHSLEAPIIHRDIKPENVLLQLTGPVTPGGEEEEKEPFFWEPPPQQRREGYPRKRLGANAGGGGFLPRQQLDAKLADLGLGVRVCANRSVLIRRRTTPVPRATGGNAAAPGAEGLGGPDAAPDDDTTIRLLFGLDGVAGGGGGGQGAAAEVRTPFMGFTTMPCKPPKRQSSSSNNTAKQRSRRRSANGGGGGAADASAASPSPGSETVPAAASAVHSPASLHRTMMVNIIRARLSGTHENAANGGTTGPSEPWSAAAATATASATAGSGGGGSSEISPSPFRDIMQQQQLSGCHNPNASEITGASDGPQHGLHGDGGAAPSPALSPTRGSLADGGGLEPISERSLSSAAEAVAEEGDVGLLGSDSDCRSATGTLQGTTTLGSSGKTNTTNGGGGGGPVAGFRSSLLRPVLDTIQEPEDDCPPPLPTAASAPAAAGAPNSPSQPHNHLHRLHQTMHVAPTLAPVASRPAPPPAQSPPPPPPPPGGAFLAGLRSSLQRVAVAAAGALSSRGSATAAAAVGAAAVDCSGGVNGYGGGDGQGGDAAVDGTVGVGGPKPVHEVHTSPSSSRGGEMLQPSTSVPLPSCRIDLAAAPPAGQPQPPPHTPLPAVAAAAAAPQAAQRSPAAQSPPRQPLATAPVFGSRGYTAASSAQANSYNRQLRSSSHPNDHYQQLLPASAGPGASAGAAKERTSTGLSSLLRPAWVLRELRHVDSLGRAMRRMGSLLRALNRVTLPRFRRDSPFQWVYGLTGQAGSCMYMAPEVFRGEPYNEKVDVYSFGVMMYELLARELLLATYIGGTRLGLELGVRDPQQYAKKVCEGFRPPRHPRISDPQWCLIQACWHPDPVVRPDMSEVLATLEAAAAAAAERNGDGGGRQQQQLHHPPGPLPTSLPPLLKAPSAQDQRQSEQEQQQQEQQQDLPERLGDRSREGASCSVGDGSGAQGFSSLPAPGTSWPPQGERVRLRMSDVQAVEGKEMNGGSGNCSGGGSGGEAHPPPPPPPPGCGCLVC